MLVLATGVSGAESKVAMDPLLKPEIRNSPARETPGLLDKMLAGPLKEVPAVVVALQPNIGGAGIEGDFGWTLHGQRGFQPGCDPETMSMAEKQSRLLPTPKFSVGPSRLLRVDLRAREVTTLYEDPNGGVLRNPCVSYDGTKILVSMRKADEIRYHLYELTLDSAYGATSVKHVRQITDGPDDEVEPCYLPDGGIIYVSSKAHRFTPCNQHCVGNLWRCEADGSKQRRLTNSMDADRFPWVLADGRIVFTRWDYVHRDQGSFFALWSINPDGTGLMTYYGNQDFFTMGGPSYAKPIPGSDRVVSVIAYVHNTNGPVATIDTQYGPDDPTACRITSLGNPISTVEMLNTTATSLKFFNGAGDLNGPGPDGRPLRHQSGWTDPWPISDGCFLVANNYGERKLCVMDGSGNYEVICTVEPERLRSSSISIAGWEVSVDSSAVLGGARPLTPRDPEPVIPHRTDWSRKTGTLTLADIYQGRQFRDTERGSIESLMVMELLPEPLRFGIGTDQGICGKGPYNPTRYLGSVPVEPDGSAYFEVPALRSLCFIAVDRQGREVKYMRSQVSVMPGEEVSCVGCHEQRSQAAYGSGDFGRLLATRRQPSRLSVPESIRHTPVSYAKDIQPILDRHCVSCHSAEKPEGHVILEGDHTPKWTVAYSHLYGERQIAALGVPTVGNDPVGPILAAASPLMDKLKGEHYDVRASEEELLTVRIWIAEDSKYGPFSASSYAGRIHPMDPIPACDTQVLADRCYGCHVDPSKEQKNWDGTRFLDRNGLYCGLFAWPEPDRINCDRSSALINLDHPKKSILLQAPLAIEEGGLGWCLQSDARSKVGHRVDLDAPPAVIFQNAEDPDYRRLLQSIERASAHFHQNLKRFDMPGYRPNPWYPILLKQWGVLPHDFDIEKHGWNSELVDDLYFDHALFPETEHLVRRKPTNNPP